MINKRAAKTTAANLLREVPMVIGAIIAGCLSASIVLAVIYFLGYFIGPWSLVLFCGSILVFAIVSLIKDLVKYIRLDYRQNIERFKDE